MHRAGQRHIVSYSELCLTGNPKAQFKNPVPLVETGHSSKSFKPRHDVSMNEPASVSSSMHVKSKWMFLFACANPQASRTRRGHLDQTR